MILYEEGVQRPQLPGTELPTGPSPPDLLERADALKTWFRSLAYGYSPWPSHLPSPNYYANSAERYFGEKANHVFQHATAFLLNHERAHAVFEHLPMVGAQPNDRELRLQLEKEKAAIEVHKHAIDSSIRVAEVHEQSKQRKQQAKERAIQASKKKGAGK